MKRARLLTIILLSLMGLSVSYAQQGISKTISHGPYIQNVTDHSVTILFTTNKLVVPGVLIKAMDHPASLVQNSHDGLFDVGEGLHKISIQDLEPGTFYEYRLFTREIEDYQAYGSTFGDTVISESFRFKTLEDHKESLRFTIFCDLHDQAEKLSKYLDHNDIGRQDCYFLNGDILGHIDEVDQLYSSFIDTCVNRFASEIPFYYVRGNHETRGPFARQLKEFIDLPDDRYYYAFNQGPVRFIVLDGGEDKPDDHKEYSGLVDFDVYRAEELSWLKKEVASDAFMNAEFRIVVIHMPIIKSERNWYGMSSLAKHFGPVLKAAGIDLMISGHTHRNAYIESQDAGFGYPVMISSNNHFIEVEANQHGLSMDLKDIEGHIIQQYAIGKE